MPHQLWHHVKTGKPGLGLFQLQINRIYRQAQREPAFTPEPIARRWGSNHQRGRAVSVPHKPIAKQDTAAPGSPE